METVGIRGFSEFCDELNEIRLKFHKWDTCEKTVGIYYLLLGLPFANARFIQNALEQYINRMQCHEAQVLEANANDTNFLSSCLAKSPQLALSLILTHLPLLRPGNKEAADCYLKIITHLMTESLSSVGNEFVDIFSYLFIHPAFTEENKKSSKDMLKQMVYKVLPPPPKFEGSPDVNEDTSSQYFEFAEDSMRLPPIRTEQQRSHSLTPYTQDVLLDKERWTLGNVDGNEPSQKPRSYSLCTEVPLLQAPNKMVTYSETRLSELVLTNNLPAMKSIISWLKSLRLHKYSWLFHNLTYSQVINLKEEDLSAIGITKGARHKLLLSISKLNERATVLNELEAEVIKDCDLSVALKKLKSILQSPLQLTTGEDLVTQFIKVTGKVCTQLLMLQHRPDDLVSQFTSLCEDAETTDHFSEDQKRRLAMWKDQLLVTLDSHARCSYTHSHKGYDTNTFKRNKYSNRCYASKTYSTNTYSRKCSSFAKNKPAHRHSVGSETLKSQLLKIKPKDFLNPTRQEYFNDDWATDSRKLFVKERPSNSSVDIETNLESLCIQMMEHALGP
ncbi:unnamed protein product [Acanthoscelides obtectus]|uniref:SAM domain-containing protein n=1 Tax=Acanthoscelides obtectus TaxID=200917 RepID=A0A9P0LHM9_ACAOB|nr:unnamed protein product [Acanthoscelides obtectus]CAK1675998.1 Protein Smaug homolog 1 [Acanthoscelides obtectus]